MKHTLTPVVIVIALLGTLGVISILVSDLAGRRDASAEKVEVSTERVEDNATAIVKKKKVEDDATDVVREIVRKSAIQHMRGSSGSKVVVKELHVSVDGIRALTFGEVWYLNSRGQEINPQVFTIRVRKFDTGWQIIDSIWDRKKFD